MNEGSMQNEEWRPIPGYEGYYEASNLGRIRSLGYWQTKRGGGQFRRRGRLRVQIRGTYLYVTLCKDKIQRKYCVHKLVLMAFIPNPQNKPQGNHIDGNKYNNNLFNLEWATKSENAIHAFRLGLSKAPGLKGSSTGTARLSESQVQDIRDLYSTGTLTQPQLSKKFNVAVSTISAIILRKTWNHI